MEKRLVTTEVYVAIDGTEFRDAEECLSYEQKLKDNDDTHFFMPDKDGNWNSVSLDVYSDAAYSDFIVFDTFSAYSRHVEEYGDFDDELDEDSQFPAAFRYDDDTHRWVDWRKERARIKKLLDGLDKIFDAD